MSKIKFVIGGSPGINFNLPTKAFGDSSICMGRVAVDAGELRFASDLSFRRDDLLEFCEKAKSIRTNLTGSTSIESTCEAFYLLISAIAKGHLEVTTRMRRRKWAYPDNAEWESTYRCFLYPDALDGLIRSDADLRAD